MSFQAESFDLMRFGSSSTASVKAQSYEIWMTQSHHGDLLSCICCSRSPHFDFFNGFHIT